MTKTQNLWGELPTIEKIRTPLSILREQAAFLGQLTNRLLEGEVVVNSTTIEQIEAHLNIIAPTLDSYSVTILTIRYGFLDMYPVHLQHALDDSVRISAKDEESLINALQRILTSVSVQKVIKVLLIQIHSLN
jgi:hypothetical protein